MIFSLTDGVVLGVGIYIAGYVIAGLRFLFFLVTLFVVTAAWVAYEACGVFAYVAAALILFWVIWDSWSGRRYEARARQMAEAGTDTRPNAL